MDLITHGPSNYHQGFISCLATTAFKFNVSLLWIFFYLSQHLRTASKIHIHQTTSSSFDLLIQNEYSWSSFITKYFSDFKVLSIQTVLYSTHISSKIICIIAQASFNIKHTFDISANFLLWMVSHHTRYLRTHSNTEHSNDLISFLQLQATIPQ